MLLTPIITYGFFFLLWSKPDRFLSHISHTFLVYLGREKYDSFCDGLMSLVNLICELVRLLVGCMCYFCLFPLPVHPYCGMLLISIIVDDVPFFSLLCELDGLLCFVGYNFHAMAFLLLTQLLLYFQ